MRILLLIALLHFCSLVFAKLEEKELPAGDRDRTVNIELYKTDSFVATFLAAYGRMKNTHLKKDSTAEAIQSLGFSAFELRASKNWAYDFSEQFCGIPINVRRRAREKANLDGKPFPFPMSANQNEADAIRHFAVSALLTVKYGFSKARNLMNSREEGLKVDHEELMDLYNNAEGFAFGQRLAILIKGQNLPEETIKKRIIEEARQQIQKGKLAVNFSGGSRQAGCTVLRHYPNKKYASVDPADFFVLSGSLPVSCKKLPHQKCRVRKSQVGKSFCFLKSLNVDLLKTGKQLSNLKQMGNITTAQRTMAQMISKERKKIIKCQRDLRRMLPPTTRPRAIPRTPTKNSDTLVGS